jgi:DNA modification methylase
VKVSKLKYNPDNPRKISPEQLDKLVKSIESLPKMMELRPIVYDPATMYVLGGNQRLAALRKMGMKEIPDNWTKSTDDMTDKEKREFVLRDNVQAGEWDYSALDENFADFDLDDIGIELPEIMLGDLRKVEDDEYTEPDIVETDIKVGDLFSLRKDGKEIHRLMCGDSTSDSDIAQLFTKNKSEMLFTSPPYSDMRDYGGNVDLSVDYISGFIPAWKKFCAYQVVNLGIQRKDHNIVTYWDTYIEKAKAAGYLFLAWNVWVKASGAGTVGQQSAFFPIIHEWIFVFGEAFKHIYRTVDKKCPDKQRCGGQRQKDGSIKKSSVGKTLEKKELESAIICNAELGEIRSKHPATFSIDLPAEYIKAMTSTSDIVCDPFMGSGSTMVACHQLDRKCYGMEIEPTYCQVSLDRMRKLDPDIEVVKIDG